MASDLRTACCLRLLPTADLVTAVLLTYNLHFQTPGPGLSLSSSGCVSSFPKFLQQSLRTTSALVVSTLGQLPPGMQNTSAAFCS